MKVSELLRMITKAGCYLINHGKEHNTWYSPITGIKFRVPRHKGKELKTGTADSILKDAGLK